MKTFEGDISKDVLGDFSSSIGSSEFFSYVGNVVTLEQAIAVVAILTPDFVEHDGHVFWVPNASEYDFNKHKFSGFTYAEDGSMRSSSLRKDVERYRNNFAVSQFFFKWEDIPDYPIVMIDLSEKDYRHCHIFANQIVKYWRIELVKKFPEKRFQFEVSDDLLDEYGVCLTFWQIT